MEWINVNSSYYEPILNDLVENRYNGKLMGFLAMASMFGMPEVKTRKRPNVDIVKEFELIQNKQSALCKSDRDWVVAVFNQQYKIVPNPPKQ
jgi:hypothetical protein